MKRKKWTEHEEKTLITKYQDLKKSGTLTKLKTREKKFKPIADHINSIHNNQDPISFPFKWTWRDVSIKVQNMRHQYLGVKQKIRVSNRDFNWDDGVNHWENFIVYKDVFGDVELDHYDADLDGLGLGFGFDDDGGGSGSGSGSGSGDGRRGKRGRVAGLGAEVVELREVLMNREEKRREREFVREEGEFENESENGGGVLKEKKVMEMEFERRARLEREIDEVREWRMKMEEKRDEEDMEWRERMLNLQVQHEKQMLHLYAHSCQNQMHIVGLLARFVCQFFGSPSDGLGGGLSPQVLQNLQHPGHGGLGDNVKPGSNSPSGFI